MTICDWCDMSSTGCRSPAVSCCMTSPLRSLSPWAQWLSEHLWPPFAICSLIKLILLFSVLALWPFTAPLFNRQLLLFVSKNELRFLQTFQFIASLTINLQLGKTHLITELLLFNKRFIWSDAEVPFVAAPLTSQWFYHPCFQFHTQ